MKAYISSFFALVIFWGCSSRVAKEQKEQTIQTTNRPNVLFILTDDQRAGTIAALGNREAKTPNMDRLVRAGVSFRHNYIMGALNGAVCAPSRAMLMSGRGVFHIEPEGHSIDAVHKTLPQVFKENGYETFHTGKWHNGKESFARSFTKADHIFFEGMSEQYNIPLYDFQTSGRYPDSLQRVSRGKHSAELYADAAVNFISGYRNEQPFFMYVAF